MNRDDIIRMAREAGFDKWDNTCLSGKSDLDEKLAVGEYAIGEAVFKFAKLVAAAEREKLKHELLTLEKWRGMALAKDGDGRTVQEIEREAVAAEREAIARMIEDSPPLVSFAQNEMGGCVMCGFTPKLAALTIRARGEK
jgi:hypothetical protein